MFAKTMRLPEIFPSMNGGCKSLKQIIKLQTIEFYYRYSTKKYYNFQENKSLYFGFSDQFTQIIWKSTKELGVGCAINKYDFDKF